MEFHSYRPLEVLFVEIQRSFLHVLPFHEALNVPLIHLMKVHNQLCLTGLNFCLYCPRCSKRKSNPTEILLERICFVIALCDFVLHLLF